MTSASMHEAEMLGFDYEVPFKGIVEQSIAGIYILQDGRFQYVNETFANMCGLRREHLIGARLLDVANPQQAAALMSQYERSIQGQRQQQRFVIHRTSLRRPGSFEIHGTPVIFHGRPAIVGVGIDITEQEMQRRELLVASSRLQELIANANSVRENERHRVARELHDVIGGMLTAIKFDLSRLSWGLRKLSAHAGDRRVALDDVEQTAENLSATVEQLMALTQETVEAVRNISEGLRPGALDHLGLTDTLQHSLDQFQGRFGIRAQLHKLTECRPLPRDTEVVIYRIFQESLTNVARHSKATEVTVTLSMTAHELTLQIADNGLGFGAEQAPADGHLGLLGMQERARELGGRIEYGTGPRSGACIRLTVPMALTADHAEVDQ